MAEALPVNEEIELNEFPPDENELMKKWRIQKPLLWKAALAIFAHENAHSPVCTSSGLASRKMPILAHSSTTLATGPPDLVSPTFRTAHAPTESPWWEL